MTELNDTQLKIKALNHVNIARDTSDVELKIHHLCEARRHISQLSGHISKYGFGSKIESLISNLSNS